MPERRPSQARRGARRRVPPSRPQFRLIALTIALPALALLAASAWFILRDRMAGSSAPLPVLKASVPKATSPIAQKAAIPERPRSAGVIVLILDDVGFQRELVEQAAKIDSELSFAVIPGAPQAEQLGRWLQTRGFEVLCHLPMEPENFPAVSPGNNAILTSLSGAEIRRRTLAAAESLPFARGVNNHMGSRATVDERVMREVLGILKGRNMYFVDSRTSNQSKGFAMARAEKIPAAARDIFLDNIQTERAIRIQLAQLVALAEKRGLAVGIGHVYPQTIRVLAAEVPKLKKRGFRFARVSEVVH